MNAGETTIDSDGHHSHDWRRTAMLVLVAICAGTGLVWSLERTQHSYTAVLLAQKTIVTSRLSARLKEISVTPGRTVSPGDRLFELADTELADRIVAKQREIAELTAEVMRSNASAQVEITWRRRELQADIFETQLKIAAFSQEKLNKQVEQLAWKDRLNANDASVVPIGTVLNSQFRSISLDLQRPDDQRFLAMLREDAAAATVETLTAQITLCDRRLKNLESLDKELDGRIRASSGVDVAEARLSGAKNELTALEGQVEGMQVVSPIHGRIGDIHFQQGQHVTNGSAVIEILNDEQPHVIARIPARQAAKVRQAAEVTLIFPGNERRSGIVVSIPTQASAGTNPDEPVLSIKIEPTGRLWPTVALGTDLAVILKSP